MLDAEHRALRRELERAKDDAAEANRLRRSAQAELEDCRQRNSDLRAAVEETKLRLAGQADEAAAAADTFREELDVVRARGEALLQLAELRAWERQGRHGLEAEVAELLRDGLTRQVTWSRRLIARLWADRTDWQRRAERAEEAAATAAAERDAAEAARKAAAEQYEEQLRSEAARVAAALTQAACRQAEAETVHGSVRELAQQLTAAQQAQQHAEEHLAAEQRRAEEAVRAAEEVARTELQARRGLQGRMAELEGNAERADARAAAAAAELGRLTERHQAELKRLEADHHAAEQRALDERYREREAASDRADELEQAARQAEAAAAHCGEELRRATEQRVELQERLEALQCTLRTRLLAGTTVQAQHERVPQLMEQLHKAGARVAELEAALAAEQARVEQLQRDRDEAEQAAADRDAAMRDMRASETAWREELGAAREREGAAAGAALAALRAERDALDSEARGLRHSLADAQAALAAAEARYARAEREILHLASLQGEGGGQPPAPLSARRDVRAADGEHATAAAPAAPLPGPQAGEAAAPAAAAELAAPGPSAPPASPAPPQGRARAELPPQSARGSPGRRAQGEGALSTPGLSPRRSEPAAFAPPRPPQQPDAHVDRASLPLPAPYGHALQQPLGGFQPAGEHAQRLGAAPSPLGVAPRRGVV